jgi:hypothetical protein
MLDTLAPIGEALNKSLVAGPGMPIDLDNFSTHPPDRTPIEPGDASELLGAPSLLDLAWGDRGVDADPARRFDWLSPV